MCNLNISRLPKLYKGELKIVLVMDFRKLPTIPFSLSKNDLVMKVSLKTIFLYTNNILVYNDKNCSHSKKELILISYDFRNFDNTFTLI